MFSRPCESWLSILVEEKPIHEAYKSNKQVVFFKVNMLMLQQSTIFNSLSLKVKLALEDLAIINRFQSKQIQSFELKVQIEEIKVEYMQKIGDKKRMQECQQNIRKYFKKITEKDQEISPIEAARYYAIKALANKKSDFNQYQALIETAIQIIKQNDPYHQEIGKLSQSVADQRLARIKNILNYSSKKIIKTKGKEQTQKKLKQKFDYQQHKKLYKKCRSSYNQAIQIASYHNGKDHRKSIVTQNKLAELNVEFSLLKQAEYSALAVTKRKYAEKHSEGARSYLLLSKISLCRGQLKKAFKMLDQAERILNTSLCPRNNKSFILKHSMYYEINLTKAKIFHKQMRYDLALRQLNLLQKVAQKQTGAHQLLACIHQIRGDIKLDQKDNSSFEKEIQKAVELRTRVQGKFNVNIGTSLQKLAMALKNIKQEKKSTNAHALAVQIFSRFPFDHPNCWIVHLANAIIFKDKKPGQTIAQELQQCLKVAQKRFSPDNINLALVQIQVCKILVELGLENRALNLYQIVDRNLENQLKLSLVRQSSLFEKDDEKIGLRKKVLRQMIILYETVKGSQLAEIIGVQRCKNNLSLLVNDFNDDRNDSLKSLT